MADGEDDEGLEGLVQGRDAWWHFMEAQARGELGADASPLSASQHIELQDVGRVAQRAEREARPSFRVAPTLSLRCDHCAAQVPADLTFCVYCGAPPRFGAAAREQLLIVDRVEDPGALDELMRIIVASNAQRLTRAELESALAEPPAVFHFSGRDEHAAVLVTRLAELGVSARTSLASAPTVSMPREVVESIARKPAMWGTWVALLLGAAIAAWAGSRLVGSHYAGLWMLSVLVAAVAAAGGLGWAQTQRFRHHYELDVVSVLNGLTGFSHGMVQRAVSTLGALRDGEVKEMLTVGLMEYYAVWRQLSAAPPEVRPLLSEVKAPLDELIGQMIVACARYAELESFLTHSAPEQLEAQLATQQGALLREHDPATARARMEQIGQLERQAQTAREVAASITPFKARLRMMMSSMETLRGRVVSLTLRADVRSEHSAMLVSQVMLDLDAELSAAEQVLDVIGSAVSSRR